MNVEIHHFIWQRVTGIWLQWGHVQMNVEISRRCFTSLFLYLASMGPRSNERGNKKLWEAEKELCKASMGPRSNERGNSGFKKLYLEVKVCFNGATFKWTWKYHRNYIWHSCYHRFNGATFKWTWKFCLIGKGNPIIIRFNGATFKWTWKYPKDT